MKVSVLGAGAIGSMLGGLIKQHTPDADVMLIVRGAHGEAITRSGQVRLLGPWGSCNVPVHASFDVADIAGSDFVLLTVKSQATEEAITAAAPYRGDAVIISIQNGINDAVLAEHVPAARLVMGMTATNMAVLEPGIVSLQLGGYSLVGPNSAGTNTATSRRAYELLSKTGLQFAEHPNILGTQYNKLAINALGYASCLSQSNFITEAVCHRQWREYVGRPIVEECLTVFRYAGIKLGKIPGRPGLERLRRVLRGLDLPVIGKAIELGARQIYNKKPILFSLGQDLLRGKPTEVDYINGQVVRLAAEHGLLAPCNERVVQLVHELEQRGAGNFFTRDEVIQQFRNPARSSATPATVDSPR